MPIFLILFVILIVWGLKDEDLYWKEALCWTVVFGLLFCGFLFLAPVRIECIVGLLVTDAILLYKVVGSDIVIS